MGASSMLWILALAFVGADGLLRGGVSQSSDGFQLVGKLAARVDAGGLTAGDALAKLIGISSRPNMKNIMRVNGLESRAQKLMTSEASSDELRGLAGSLITILSGAPVASEIADEVSGSYGHVNIVVPRPSRIYGPDHAMLKLRFGASPSDI